MRLGNDCVMHDFFRHLLWDIPKTTTLPKTNSEFTPENKPSQKEISIPTIHFQVWAVRFRESTLQYSSVTKKSWWWIQSWFAWWWAEESHKYTECEFHVGQYQLNKLGYRILLMSRLSSHSFMWSNEKPFTEKKPEGWQHLNHNHVMLTDVLDTQKLNQILYCFRLFFVVYKMFVVCSLFGVLCCLQNVCCLLFVRCSLLFVVVFNVRSKPLVNFHSRLSRRSMQTYAPTTMTTHQSGALSKAK